MGFRHTTLVASKSRLAPLSELTIPRLELIAAVITSRLITTVKKALESIMNIDRYYCWTDSKAVLYWITRTKELKQFVDNRVSTILELTTVDMWGHCPGTQNPADVGSRGCFPSEIESNSTWWEGPSWLKGPPDCYPKLDGFIEETDVSEDCLKEFRVKNAKQNDPGSTTSFLTYALETHNAVKPMNVSEVIDCTRYSKPMKLSRVTATVLRFIAILKTRSDDSKQKLLRNTEISQEDVITAEKLWIRDAQREMEQQKNWKDLQKQLSLFKDEEGIIRSRERLAHSLLPVEAKFPILLPREHYLTRLIVEHCHREVQHGGVKETLT